jgi:hypothetical protein
MTEAVEAEQKAYREATSKVQALSTSSIYGEYPWLTQRVRRITNNHALQQPTQLEITNRLGTTLSSAITTPL